MKVHGKRILSAFLALVMVVGLLPATAMAALVQGDGTEDNPIVVYRNPVEDYAANGFSTDDIAGALAGFTARDTTMNAWRDQIIAAANVGGDDVYYHVETIIDRYVSVSEKFIGLYHLGAWFGWTAARNHLAGEGSETRVKVVDKADRWGENDEYLTDDLNVKVKGYVDVKYVIDENTSYTDYVSLDYAINDAEDDADKFYTAANKVSYGATDTDYAFAAAAATAKATAMTNESRGTAKYIFAGWDTDGDTNTVEIKADAVGDSVLAKTIDVTSDDGCVAAETVEGTTFTAVYDAEYLVTWQDEKGAVISSEFVASGKTPVAPDAPDKEGYTFKGWNSEIVAVTNQPQTYTAVYEIHKYTVTWVNDDDKVLETDENVAYGTIPTYDGPTPVAQNTEAGKTYTFIGWTPVVGAANKDVTYTATYSNATTIYTVAFDANGGSPVADATVGHGETITANTTTTREGYRFNGWYLDGEAFNLATPITGNITLKADWVKQVTVTFDSGVAAQTMDVNSTATEPTDPKRDGFVFDGWYNDNTKYAFETPVTEDITLTAKWLEEFTVTFNSNGGTAVESQTIVEGQKATEPAAPTKSGYDFKGWYVGNAEYNFDTVVNGNVTLTAKWEKTPAKSTEIVANDNLVVTYGITEAELKELIAPVVKCEGADISGEVEMSYFGNLDAGEKTVTLKYAGNDKYAASEKKVTVTIKKAPANVVVSSQTVKYGQTPADPFKANCNTIDVLAGLDVHDETYLVGSVQVALPADLMILVGLAAGSKYDLNDLTVDDVKALMLAASENEQVGAIVGELAQYKDTIEKLIATLEKIQNELPMDSELKISVVSEIKLPTNIGVYLAASLASDKNYEAVNANDGLDAGYLIITPNGIKAELSWNENDDNHIITLDKYADFDLGATAKVIDSTVEGANKTDEVEDHLEYIFVGVDANGELLLNRTTNVTEMADAAIGVYAQVAYVANWDNVMYYAEPIARPIVIAPDVADVAILDVNGNENYAQVFTYDGDAKAVKVTVDGVENAEGLTVKYIGSDTTVDGWYRTEAPTDAGVYTVVATYTEKNDAGELVKAGGAVGVLIIEPADADITMPDAEYKYDGAEHFPKLTEGFDFVTVAIDREDNVAYVNLPEDTADHIDRIVTMMPAEVENELRAFLKKYENFDGEAQTATLKTELSAIIDKAVAVDMTAKAEAMAEKLVDKLAEALKNNQDIDTLVEKIKTEIAALEDAIRNEIPDKVEQPLEDYIRDIVTITENGVDIDLEKAKADIKAMIDQVKDELPDPVVAELYEMVDELTRAIEGKVDVEALKDKATQIVEELKSLEVADAETLVKAVIGAIYNNLDMTQIQSLLEQVVAKVEARGYVDYLKNMVKAISGMYEGKIDTTEVETAIDALITKIEKKIESGNFDADDLEALETSVDAILNSLKSVVNQSPEGTIIFGKNPTEVGEYGCYAMNISANYKWEFVESKMKIYYEITFDANGGSGEMDAERIIVDTYTLPENGFTAPTGKHFVGWSLAANGTVISSESIDVRDNTTLYAIWAQNSTGGNTGGGGGSSRPDIEDPNITGVVNYLNTDDHFPFMVGDDKGAFRPNANITRAEVAQVFYALLKDKNVTITAGFDDVEEGIWYETAVNTLASMGIVAGVGDGKFEPERPITRAEFAAIAAKFAKKSYTGMKFDDVSEDHWAYPGICTAASYGWVTGIGDNKFGPMQKITRAEVATIVNHMLGRLGDWDAIDNGEGRWFPDVTKSHWAWYEIAEATTDHDYKFNQKRTEETWSKSKPNPPMQ